MPGQILATPRRRSPLAPVLNQAADELATAAAPLRGEMRARALQLADAGRRVAGHALAEHTGQVEQAHGLMVAAAHVVTRWREIADDPVADERDGDGRSTRWRVEHALIAMAEQVQSIAQDLAASHADDVVTLAADAAAGRLAVPVAQPAARRTDRRAPADAVTLAVCSALVAAVTGGVLLVRALTHDPPEQTVIVVHDLGPATGPTPTPTPTRTPTDLPDTPWSQP